MKTENSEKLYKKAVTLMPGGVNSPVRAFNAVGRTPLFIKSAKGSKITDVDCNEFIDYVCSWGPGILGHAREEVISAVQEACKYGLTYGAPTEKESILAEMVMSLHFTIPFSSSGISTSFFSICYHGHSDGLLVKSGSGLITNAVADSAGVPKAYTQCTLVAEYNNKKSVEELFDKYPNQIACLVVEPVAANMGVVPPKDGFLEFLRDITEKNNTVLIFDEVITGFRLALGGASEYFGVKPDMVTLGKIVGGGMPVGAYGGRKEIMQTVSPVGKVYQAGTLSGNPIAVTAGIETLKILMGDPDIYKRIDKKAEKIEKAFLSTGKVTVNRVGSLISAFFTKELVTDYNSAMASDTKEYAKYFSYMLENGIYVAPSQFEAMFVSDAHSDDDIQKTVNSILNFK